MKVFDKPNEMIASRCHIAICNSPQEAINVVSVFTNRLDHPYIAAVECNLWCGVQDYERALKILKEMKHAYCR